ncbi:MAG: TonB-dependent receptor family protein [Cryomorphaceae bacterium]|nr:TonB-dependent receptor family protein [Cryomorphaceae bacterium]
MISNRRDQIYGRPTESTLAIFQGDYERKLGKNFKLETGLKSTLLREYREQIFDEFNFATNEYESNLLIADEFTFNEHVHAAYFTLKNAWNRWSYQAGVRAEWSLTNSHQPKIDCTFVNNYLDFFPSAYVSYKLNENHEITSGYSRRINRPNVWRLAPFINAQDLFNLRIGSPYVQPEYTDNFEVALNRDNSKWNFTGTIFYRNTTNAMTRVYSMFG